MKKSSLFDFMVFGLLLTILSASGFSAQKKQPLRFASGFQGGTYYQIGTSLEKIDGLTFDVQTTSGSKENIQLIRDRKADFGMVQLDILINAARLDAKVMANVKILLPVFSEEIHLLASKDIQSFADLKGKKVSIGPKNSGIQGTARIILEQLKLKSAGVKIEQLPTFIALQQLLIKRKIDAMFIVAGAPVEMLATIPAEAKNVIKILPFSDSEISNLTVDALPYKNAQLKSKDYPWMANDVKTIAVDSVLVVRSDIKAKHVKKIIDSIFANKSKFISYHKKWQELDIDNIRKILEKRKVYFHSAAIETINSL